jgi:hypothetical protein
MMFRPAALLWIGIASLPARAGVTFTMEGENHKSTIRIEGPRLRIEDVQGKEDSQGKKGPRIMIFNGTTRTLTLIDPGDRTYSELHEADLRQMESQVADQMEKAIAKMPPEQQAKMREMMTARGIGAAKSATPAKKRDVTYLATGGKEQIAGHTCQSYRVVIDGTAHGEICAVPWSAGMVSRSDLDAFVKFGAFASRDFGGGAPAFDDMVSKAPGFPVLQSRLDASGNKTPGERLTSFKRAAIPADQFLPPADYTKVTKPLGPPPGVSP